MKKKIVCEKTLYVDPEGGKLYTIDEWVDHVHRIEAKNEHLEAELKEYHVVVEKLCQEKAKLKEENEQLKKDNRRMLLLIALMEKLLGVELSELI